MTAYCNDGGTWRDVDTITDVRAKSGGSWAAVQAIWAKSGGVWVKTWSRVQARWTAGLSVWDDTSAYKARALIQSSGAVLLLPNGTAGSWLPNGESAANYEVKWGNPTGAALSGNGMTKNVYYPLTTDREVSLTSAGSLQTSDADITIRHIPSGEELVVALHFEAGPGANAS